MVKLSDIKNNISNGNVGCYKVTNPTKEHLKFAECIGRPSILFRTMFEDPKTHTTLKFRVDEHSSNVFPCDFALDEIDEVTGIDAKDYWENPSFVYPFLVTQGERIDQMKYLFADGTSIEVSSTDEP